MATSTMLGHGRLALWCVLLLACSKQKELAEPKVPPRRGANEATPDLRAALNGQDPTICHSGRPDPAALEACACRHLTYVDALTGAGILGGYCGEAFYGRSDVSRFITTELIPDRHRVAPGETVRFTYRIRNSAEEPISVVLQGSIPLGLSAQPVTPMPELLQCGIGGSGASEHLLLVVEPHASLEIERDWQATERFGRVALDVPRAEHGRIGLAQCQMGTEPSRPGLYLVSAGWRLFDHPEPVPSAVIEVALPSLPDDLASACPAHAEVRRVARLQAAQWWEADRAEELHHPPAPPIPPPSATLHAAARPRKFRLHAPLPGNPHGDCLAHTWVERTLPACVSPLDYALEAWLVGLDEVELRWLGLTANDVLERSALRRLRESFAGVALNPSGVAILKFASAQAELQGSSCAATSLRSALFRTATQFVGVHGIAFTFGGVDWSAPD